MVQFMPSMYDLHAPYYRDAPPNRPGPPKCVTRRVHVISLSGKAAYLTDVRYNPKPLHHAEVCNGQVLKYGLGCAYVLGAAPHDA